ncbi:MAG TPA: hypothetical protein VGC09_03710 [Rhodopila sp.]
MSTETLSMMGSPIDFYSTTGAFSSTAVHAMPDLRAIPDTATPDSNEAADRPGFFGRMFDWFGRAFAPPPGYEFIYFGF